MSSEKEFNGGYSLFKTSDLHGRTLKIYVATDNYSGGYTTVVMGVDVETQVAYLLSEEYGNRQSLGGRE